jgi:hypothetical protein
MNIFQHFLSDRWGAKCTPKLSGGISFNPLIFCFSAAAEKHS